jgi:hypothetical protein
MQRDGYVGKSEADTIKNAWYVRRSRQVDDDEVAIHVEASENMLIREQPNKASADDQSVVMKRLTVDFPEAFASRR